MKLTVQEVMNQIQSIGDYHAANMCDPTWLQYHEGMYKTANELFAGKGSCSFHDYKLQLKTEKFDLLIYLNFDATCKFDGDDVIVKYKSPSIKCEGLYELLNASSKSNSNFSYLYLERFNVKIQDLMSDIRWINDEPMALINMTNDRTRTYTLDFDAITDQKKHVSNYINSVNELSKNMIRNCKETFMEVVAMGLTFTPVLKEIQ